MASLTSVQYAGSETVRPMDGCPTMEDHMDNESLLCYCGVYCGTCARWHEYTEFRKIAATLAESLDAQGYQHWLSEHTDEFSYDEFRKGLDFFSRDDCWVVCRAPCREGKEYDCAIRTCCRERGIELCFDCSDFPCSKFERKDVAEARAHEYRELGKLAWLRRRAEQAERGYELHTGKYYRTSASEDPQQT
jgi:hypothetical protein